MRFSISIDVRSAQPEAAPNGLDGLVAEIRACRVCARALPHEPRPVVWVHPEARILIAGQAPGRRVHESGVPWNDPSGDRLRDWMQLDRAAFYDKRNIAVAAMGFCYPGHGQWRRSTAAARMCAEMAAAPAAIAEKIEADPAGRRVRTALSSGRAGQTDARRNGARLARLSRRRHAFAASVVAEHGLAETQSMVRNRTAAGFARRVKAALLVGIALPRCGHVCQRGTHAIDAAARVRRLWRPLAAACVPTVQRAGRIGADFQGPRFDVAAHRFVSFDGTPLGLSAWLPPDSQPPQRGDHRSARHERLRRGDLLSHGPVVRRARRRVVMPMTRAASAALPIAAYGAGEQLMTEDLRTAINVARRMYPNATLVVVGDLHGLGGGDCTVRRP